MVCWGPNLNHISYLHFHPKDSRLLSNFNSQSASHLKCLGFTGGVSEDALTMMRFGHNISEKWTCM